MAKPSVLLIPRPELSSTLIAVDEFRIRAHDGIRLYGLRAQNRSSAGREPARVRVVGPCDRPQIDRRAVEAGASEFVLQEPAGRRLEDRVLDVLRVCQLAAENQTIDARRIRFVSRDHEPDEFLIASQLLADEIDPCPDGFDQDPGPFLQ